MDLTLVILIILIGDVGIFVGSDLLAYRLGEFNLMPGERQRQQRFRALSFATAFALPFGLRFFPFGFYGALLVALIATLALGGYLFFTRGRRASLFQNRPPEGRVEIERRSAFMRSRRGIALLVGTGLSMAVWTVSVLNIAAPRQ